MPVAKGLLAVLDLRPVCTSYQGKAEMGWILLFLAFVAIGFWLTKWETKTTPYRALRARRGRNF